MLTLATCSACSAYVLEIVTGRHLANGAGCGRSKAHVTTIVRRCQCRGSLERAKQGNHPEGTSTLLDARLKEYIVGAAHESPIASL